MILNSNWLAVPEILYLIINIASIVLCVLSLLFVILGLWKKKSKKYLIAWIIVLALSVTILYLTMVAHVIIADSMIGG